VIFDFDVCHLAGLSRVTKILKTWCFGLTILEIILRDFRQVFFVLMLITEAQHPHHIFVVKAYVSWNRLLSDAASVS